jgi:nitroimidazol reductase NimA-like FMN-containing flavoprotein (pyridoxamine 5'-phosphate oxidase superfamily)
MTTNILTGYPQMPALTQDEIEFFLIHHRFARLGTLNDDGTIHLAPIYYKYDKNEFLLGTQKASRRVRNIKLNPNVSLLIDDTSPPYKAVLVYGKATLDYDNIIQKRTAIFEQFETKEEAIQSAEGICNKWASVVIRIKPNRIVSFDYSKATLY